jgi:UDP-N-acetylmuramyl pentapeptide synthase
MPRPDLLVTVGEDAHLVAARAEQVGIPVRAFATAAAAAVFVREAVLAFAGPQLLLLKGSRGVHLEEVTQCLTEEAAVVADS